MNTPNKDKEAPFHLDQEVDLLLYLQALLQNKYRIVIAAIIAAIIVFGLSLLLDDKFIARSLVAININEAPGSIKPGAYTTSDTLGLLENDFILASTYSRSNETNRILAMLNSYAFNVRFIEEENLLPYLFKKQWDAENKKWLKGEPDMRLAQLAFSGIMSFKKNEENGLLNIFFTTTNPELSARLANNVITSFNRYIKEQQTNVIAERKKYLQQRLNEIDNIELHRSIYRMIETQIGAESLLHARKDYPFETIQPALPPLFKAAPSRKQYAALTFIGFVFLGCMVVVGNILLKKLQAGLNQYKHILGPGKPETNSITAGKTPEHVQNLEEWVE